MNKITKAAQLQKAVIGQTELALINRQTLRPFNAEELYVFRLAACDSQVDRDFERFTPETLRQLAKLFTGRPVLLDHLWSAEKQTARVYDAACEESDGVTQLILHCYTLRTEKNADTIAAIDGGILRECSVGLAVRRAVCSICGADQSKALCEHIPGRSYGGAVCHMDLEDAADAYEVSLVAVPAQREAGVLKSKRYGGAAPEPGANWRAEAALELEKNRFWEV